MNLPGGGLGVHWQTNPRSMHGMDYCNGVPGRPLERGPLATASLSVKIGGEIATPRAADPLRCSKANTFVSVSCP
jgi:hypothetical protein